MVKERLEKLGHRVAMRTTEEQQIDLVVILYCRDITDRIDLYTFAHQNPPILLVGHCRNHTRINGATHINASDDDLAKALENAVDIDKKYQPHHLVSEIL
jgi:hypothetical protein